MFPLMVFSSKAIHFFLVIETVVVARFDVAVDTEVCFDVAVDIEVCFDLVAHIDVVARTGVAAHSDVAARIGEVAHSDVAARIDVIARTDVAAHSGEAARIDVAVDIEDCFVAVARTVLVDYILYLHHYFDFARSLC